MKLTLPFSAAAHLGLIVLLFLLPATVSVPPKLDLSNAIAVIFAPPPAAAPPAQALPPPPPPQVVEQPPPPPEPPPQAIEQPPAPPAPVAETPSPRPAKPEPKSIPKPRPRPQAIQQPAEQPMPQLPLPIPSQPSQTNQATQMAAIPPPAPTISPEYRTLLSGWLESHKRYPEEARQRGEEGRAVLRFRVDRYGRVLDYVVVSSTGYADLDAAVQNMMRGATMPPFPPSMREPEIEVSVTIRYGLAR